MTAFWRGWCLLALLAVAACQSDPPHQQQAAPGPTAPPMVKVDTVRTKAVPLAESDTAAAGPAASAAAPGTDPDMLQITLPRYLRSHRRYVGTIGGKEMVVELLPDDNPYRLLAGSLYFVHDPHVQLFEGELKGPGKPAKSLKLEMYSDSTPNILVLLPPFGPHLRASWVSPQGAAPQYLTLHESYAGAVHYEVLTATAKGRPMAPQDYGDVVGSIPSYTRAYLHLLGPDTLRPELRRLQALPPKRMQKAVRYHLRHVAEGGCDDTEYLYVTLNGYGLLSYGLALSSYMFGGAHPERSEKLHTVDLRTGLPTRWQTWFRPGTEAALRQLIYRQLLATRDTADLFDHVFDPGTGMRALPEEFGLNPIGIVAHYGDYELAAYVHGPTDVVLPFAEVAPLLNRGTALDRILAARGLRAGR